MRAPTGRQCHDCASHGDVEWHTQQSGFVRSAWVRQLGAGKHAHTHMYVWGPPFVRSCRERGQTQLCVVFLCVLFWPPIDGRLPEFLPSRRQSWQQAHTQAPAAAPIDWWRASRRMHENEPFGCLFGSAGSSGCLSHYTRRVSCRMAIGVFDGFDMVASAVDLFRRIEGSGDVDEFLASRNPQVGCRDAHFSCGARSSAAVVVRADTRHR